MVGISLELVFQKDVKKTPTGHQTASKQPRFFLISFQFLVRFLSVSFPIEISA
jgi:hypothetical protein